MTERQARFVAGFLGAPKMNLLPGRLLASPGGAAWIELAGYDGATELDHQDLMQLQELITRARLRLARMTSNARRFMKRAAVMGLRPVPYPRWSVPATGFMHSDHRQPGS